MEIPPHDVRDLTSYGYEGVTKTVDTIEENNLDSTEDVTRFYRMEPIQMRSINTEMVPMNLYLLAVNILSCLLPYSLLICNHFSRKVILQTRIFFSGWRPRKKIQVFRTTFFWVSNQKKI